MIEINNIHKEFKKGKKNSHVIIDDVSFSVPSGTVYGIVGGNGAGKTTLLNCIAGVDKDFSGSIKVDGRDIRVIKKIPNVIGYVQDSFVAFPYMTCKEYFEYLGDIAGLSKKVQKDRTEMLFEMFDLSPHVNKRISLFSKGMSQKLVIASVLYGNPKAILMDEPTSNLDVDAKEELKATFNKIKNSGKAVIMSTNSFFDVENYCDVVGFLANGKIRNECYVKDVIENQKTGIMLDCNEVEFVKLKNFATSMEDIFVSRRNKKTVVTSDIRRPTELMEIVGASGIAYTNLSMFREGFKEAFIREISLR